MLLPRHEVLWGVPHVRRRDRRASRNCDRRILHRIHRPRYGRAHQDRRRDRSAARHHGLAHLRAPSRMPQLPPHRTLRPGGHLPAACRRQRPMRHVSKERALRAQGHRPMARNGAGHGAHVQQPTLAAVGGRPVLGHGLEPVHRLRSMRANLQRNSGGRRARVRRTRRQEPHRDVQRLLPPRIGLRILRSMYRRMPYRGARGARLQVGQGRKEGNQRMYQLPSRMHSNHGGGQAQPLDSHSRRQARTAESGPTVLQGQVRSRLRQQQAASPDCPHPRRRRIAGGGDDRCNRPRG